MQNSQHTSIGVFDSGYGGLTVLREMIKKMPNYDYIYLGDNARAPYGTRSFEVVYQYTLECVEYLFSQGCEIVILACNTASAKALRTIQQKVMPIKYPNKKVLGVLRPSTEIVGKLSQSKVVGILATEGTVNSLSYKIEIEKFSPGVVVEQLACPLWVPLIEANQHHTDEGRAIFKKDVLNLLKQNPKMDTVVLACTHYPLIEDYLKTVVPENVRIISQGKIVAERLKDYFKRHQEINSKLTKEFNLRFLTSETPSIFKEHLEINNWNSENVEHFNI